MSEKSDDDPFNNVPDDFPRPVHMGALPGAQPKVLAVLYEGKFYSPGCTPPELFERWSYCEFLVERLAAKELETKSGKRAHMTEGAILEQYLERLIETKWTSVAEARWIMHQVAERLKWPMH